MKTAMTSVACYSDQFSQVFINSFRQYYPKTPLVIVDNNFEGEMGKKETRYLKLCRNVKKNIIYIRNEGIIKNHGSGVDVALQYLHKNKYDLMLNVDIDTLHKKHGIIEACEEAYKEGYKYGGSWHIKHSREPWKRKRGETWHVHSSFGFYDVQTLIDLGVSFQAVKGKTDTAESISYALEAKGIKAKPIWMGFIKHFAAGCLMREDGVIAHSKGQNPEWAKYYRNKLKTFFERDDVKGYLK